MAINLLETFKAQFGDELIQLLSNFIGEKPALTRAAAERAGEATLAELIHRSSMPDGAHGLVSVLNDTQLGGDGLANLVAALQQGGPSASLIDQGKTFLSSLFGDRVDGLAQWVSNASGVGQKSAFSLMSLIAPTLLGFIKRQFSGNLNASGLLDYLNGQRGFLEKSAPEGLLSMLGWQGGTMASAKTAPSDPRPAPAVIAEPPVSERSSFPWPWLLGLLALLGLGFLFMRGCNRVDEMATTPAVKPTAPVTATVPAAPKPAEPVVVPATPKPAEPVVVPATPKPAEPVVVPATPKSAEPVELVLRDKVKLLVLPGSIEQKLVTFIEDTSKVPDNKTWFTFDGLEFETGSAMLKPASQERLKHIAAVLKAYPSVHIKLGGYTDNVGDPQKNLKISDERAKSALQELVKMGIAANRLEAEGYGEQYPVADNATEQGRQKNRRVDVRVTAK